MLTVVADAAIAGAAWLAIKRTSRVVVVVVVVIVVQSNLDPMNLRGCK